MTDDEIVSYQLRSLLADAESTVRPCMLCEHAPRAGAADADADNTIVKISTIYDAEFANEDMPTLCHHLVWMCWGLT